MVARLIGSPSRPMVNRALQCRHFPLHTSRSPELARAKVASVAMIASNVRCFALMRGGKAIDQNMAQRLLSRRAVVWSPDPLEPQQRFRLHGVRILVVEDEPDTRELVATCLEQLGALTLACPDAEDALRQFADFRPNLVVSDLSLPQASGLELVRRIRLTPAGKTIPAVALTANASLGDAASALDAGFDVHLTKPLSGDDLIEAVLSVLDLRRELSPPSEGTGVA